MKKIIKLSCLIITSLILTFLLVAGTINVYRYASKNKDDFSYLSNKANKVILFIGDGMGVNHIENTELYLDKEMFFMSFEKKGYVNTFSKNTFWPTDSAAAATAMATGKKVYNTHVGSSFGKPYISISEIAKENGLGVGIVTTDTLTGETTTEPIKVPYSVLEALQADVKVDVTPKSPFDKFAQELSLENLLKAGYFSPEKVNELEAYIDALDDGCTMPKTTVKKVINNIREKQQKIAEIKVQAQELQMRANQYLGVQEDINNIGQYGNNLINQAMLS